MKTEINDKINYKLLIEKYGPLVSSICRGMTRNYAISEEASQEVWIEIIKSFDTFKNQSRLSTWIYKIAYRTVLKYIKNEKVYSEEFIRKYLQEQTRFIQPVESDAEKKLWIKDTCNNCLTGFLYCLDHDDRFLYILREVSELPFNEIEKIMEIEPVVLRKRISRIKNKLKMFLNNECILFNPDADCRCKIKRHIQDIKLDLEFEKIRKRLDEKISNFKIADLVFSKVNYWKKYLKKCHINEIPSTNDIN